MIEPLLFYVLGLTIGWYFSRHRHITHENSRPPTGPPPLKLKRSKPIRMDEGTIQRGNGYSGPTTPKPGITPRPQPTGGRQIGPFF